MRIVMLGHTGAGKTTFMAAMYEALRKPVDGFRLVAKDAATHWHLVGLAKSIRQGRYPNPSDARASYDFALLMEGRKLLDLNLTDYRGGALVESASSTDLETLIDDLVRADGILVLLDANHLARSAGSNPEIGRVMVLLSRAIARENSGRPLTIALTKWDMMHSTPSPSRSFWQRLLDRLFDRPIIIVDQTICQRAQEEERVTRPLRGLFAAAKANGRIRSTMLPVACHGRSIVNAHLAALCSLLSGIDAAGSRLSERRRGPIARLHAKLVELRMV